MKKKVLQVLLLGMFAFLSSQAFAQFKVSGVVKSPDGEALPGATVAVKGTTTGVLSDLDGNYTITLPNDQSVLVFSFVGMTTKEVPVNGKSIVNVTLESTSIGVDEVVVTALGISREKKSLGYSVAEVKGESLQKVAQENVLNSLAGKVAGVNISSTGGPGSSVSMVIRGASSLTSDNQPLFVVDGIPMNNTLNNTSKMGVKAMTRSKAVMMHVCMLLMYCECCSSAVLAGHRSHPPNSISSGWIFCSPVARSFVRPWQGLLQFHPNLCTHHTCSR